MAAIDKKVLKMEDAVSKCSSFGGSLPTPSSNQDVQQYLNLLPNVGFGFYIGIEDKANDRNSLTYFNGEFHTQLMWELGNDIIPSHGITSR